MRDKLLRYIRERELLHPGDRVAVAVSGGADSVALLRALLDLRSDLGIVLTVAHFNHGLRGEESQADEAFVAELAKQHALEFFAAHANVRDPALTGKLSLEAAGRQLRYRWLTELAREHRLDAIATAHTLDDQAETVLLKFLRGAGSRGLAGIYPVVAKDDVRIIRPLLSISRADVETFLGSLGQPWREDETNLDRRFTRNRVRHDLLPLLEREFNPNLRALLGDAAEVSRAEEEYWQALLQTELALRLSQPRPERDLDADARVVRRFSAASQPAPFYSEPASAGGTSFPRLHLDGFPTLPLALQRRVLKSFAEAAGLALDFAHVEKLLHCALGRLPKAELPSNWLADCRDNYLELRPLAPPTESAAAYEYRLSVPGEIRIAELGLTMRVLILAEEFARALEDDSLLTPASLGPDLTVRNWRPGDRFWPAHSRSKEKLKRLFAEKRIPAEQRATWPVILHGSEIVWVNGFPAARSYEWKGKGDAVKIDVVQK